VGHAGKEKGEWGMCQPGRGHKVRILTIIKFPVKKEEMSSEAVTWKVSAQVKMSFSSGAAQTKGGGSFCMATYSFES
jgi:hypothetical protein